MTQQLECNCVCEAITLDIQDTKFTVDLYVLPIVGANVVLGMQWLKSLGPVLTDYNSLSMKFFHDGCLVELKGDKESTLNSLSSLQFRHFCRKQRDNMYFHITVLSDDHPVSTSKDLPLAIQALLNKFNSLFQAPHQLPPKRDTNHHIHLLPNSAPVNMRPYRYPH